MGQAAKRSTPIDRPLTKSGDASVAADAGLREDEERFRKVFEDLLRVESNSPMPGGVKYVDLRD